MAGSLTITVIALAIQEMVASWTSMTVSHRSIKARIVDLLAIWVRILIAGSMHAWSGMSGVWLRVGLPRYPKILLYLTDGQVAAGLGNMSYVL